MLSLSAPLTLSPERPSFEVASVRPAPEHRGRPSFDASPRPPIGRSSGRFDAIASLRDLIYWAFVPQVPIEEGSFRELDDVFEIAARASGPVLLAAQGDVGPMNQMLQSLLADRFKLRVRWETRSFPAYALRRASPDQLGRNLKPIEVDCPVGYPETRGAAPDGCWVRLSFSNGHVQGQVPHIAHITRLLSGFVGRNVVDETGLVGRFELSMTFNTATVDGPLALLVALLEGPQRGRDAPSLADALRDDLGLKLESTRHEFPVLIIEHVEQPTGN